MRSVMTVKQQEQEIERIIGGLDDVARMHLRTIIYDIVKCYEKTEDNCAVIVLGTSNGIEGAVAVNCDGMLAANLLLGANDFFGYLNTQDAPPKEMFN
jgi:hypothetical protein